MRTNLHGIRVLGLGLIELRVHGLGVMMRVWGLGFRVRGYLDFRVFPCLLWLYGCFLGFAVDGVQAYMGR